MPRGFDADHKKQIKSYLSTSLHRRMSPGPDDTQPKAHLATKTTSGPTASDIHNRPANLQILARLRALCPSIVLLISFKINTTFPSLPHSANHQPHSYPLTILNTHPSSPASSIQYPASHTHRYPPPFSRIVTQRPTFVYLHTTLAPYSFLHLQFRRRTAEPLKATAATARRDDA